MEGRERHGRHDSLSGLERRRSDHPRRRQGERNGACVLRGPERRPRPRRARAARGSGDRRPRRRLLSRPRPKLLPTLPPAELARTMVAFGRIMLRVFTFPIPTVAAVTGHAIAGGAMLAFACDLRFMAEGPFRLHLNEVAIGLAFPTWAIVLAQAAVPPRWHTEAILHARPYSPEEAFERHLVHGVARPAERV